MEYEQDPVESDSNNLFRRTVIAVIVLYVLGSAYFLYSLGSRLNKVEADQKAAIQSVEESNKVLMGRLGITEMSLKQSTEVLQSKLTKAQREAAAHDAALLKQQQETKQQLQQNDQKLSSVSTDLGGVKTDLTGAKSDLVSTKNDLDATKKRLESTIGDLGVQSGLIAHTRDDLEVTFYRHPVGRQLQPVDEGRERQTVRYFSCLAVQLNRHKGLSIPNGRSSSRSVSSPRTSCTSGISRTPRMSNRFS